MDGSGCADCANGISSVHPFCEASVEKIFLLRHARRTDRGRVQQVDGRVGEFEMIKNYLFE